MTAALATMPAPPLAAGFSGLGVFLGADSMVADIAKGTKRLLEMGATTSFVLIESVEGTRQPPSRVRDVCIAHRERDIEPILFTFPTSARIDSARAHLRECGRSANVRKVVLDLEPWKDKRTGRSYDWTERDIAELVKGVQADGFEVFITLFTRKAWSKIDWQRAAPGIPILLQVYERVSDVDELAAAIAQWPHHTVVLCVATYIGTTQRLEHDLDNATPHCRKVGAVVVWKLGSTDLPEANALCAWVVAL